MQDPQNADQEEALRSQRRYRMLRRSGFIVAVLVVLFYGGGGWYFSSQLGDDAFVVDRDEDDPVEFDIEVVSVADDEITFRAEEGSDDDLLADGVFGVELPDGWLRVGDLIEQGTENGFDIATRQLLSSSGVPPEAGTPADFDSFVYETDPSDLGLQYENVTFASPLGEFDAWFVPGDDNTWVIAVHGKGVARRECLRILGPVTASGHPALLISYRNDLGQPADPSGYHRYGATEWADVEGAVRYAIDNGADDVILVGLSTGAAHALSFVYESDLEDRVVGAIFDSPNIDFGRTVDYGASQRSLPLIGLDLPQSLTTVAKFIGSFRFDFDWSEADFIDDAEELDFPILVFHGTNDSTVPLDVSERLRDERPELVTLVVVDGAEHVQSWNDDPGGYEEQVGAFLDGIE